MGQPNVESMRDFAVILNKYGVSVKQCEEGYGIKQLLKNLGIHEETDFNGSNGNNESDANKEIILFIEETCLSCKKLGISPPMVFLWIRDLLEFYGYGHNNNHFNFFCQHQQWV